MEMILDLFVYLLFRIFVSFVNLLPKAFIWPISRIAGLVIYFSDWRDRRTVVSNLERAFGLEKTQIEKRAIARAVFQNLVLNVIEFLRVSKLSYQRIKGRIDPVNYNYIDAVIARGKGLILVTAHYGNWEMLGLMGSAVLDRHKVVTIVRTLKNRFIDRYINSLREYTHNNVIPKKGAAFEVMRTIKGNGVVCFFADQVGGNDSVAVDFFGSKALTITSPAFFSYKTGAPIIPSFFVSSGDRYKLVFEKPIEPVCGNNIDDEVKRITSEYTKVIEGYIRRAPEKWFWFHKRWKSKRAKKIYANSFKIVVHAPNWIGDAVMALPAVKGVRELFPNAKITLVVKESISSLFKNNPYIDDLIKVPDKKDLAGLLQTIRLLRRERFDLGVLFPNSFKSALLFFAGRVRHRVGYGKDGRGFLLTRAIKREKAVMALHHSDYYFRLVKEIGNIGHPDSPKIFIGEDTVKCASSLVSASLKGRGPLIGICPGGAYGPAKRWSAARYSELVSILVDRLNADVIIFGSEKEKGIAEEIKQIAKKDMIDMCGKTDLTGLAALLRQCDAVVSNDSGPMHIASAVGTPVVAIFGSTNPSATSPGGEHMIMRKKIPCSPCLKRTCEKNYECMGAIGALDVYGCVEKILKRRVKL